MLELGSYGSVGGEGGNLLVYPAVRFAERGFQQASRITLTDSYRRNNSCGDDFAHHLGLAGVSKLFKGSVQSFAHRRKCFGSERSRFYGRKN
jgi:hypothetical protein